MSIAEIKEKITPLLNKYDVAYAGVFGSFARGEENAHSDVDIVIKFKGPATFDNYLKLDNAIRSTLDKDVDLLTENSINRFLRPHIEQDLKIIYGQRPNLPVGN